MRFIRPEQNCERSKTRMSSCLLDGEAVADNPRPFLDLVWCRAIGYIGHYQN